MGADLKLLLNNAKDGGKHFRYFSGKTT